MQYCKDNDLWGRVFWETGLCPGALKSPSAAQSRLTTKVKWGSLKACPLDLGICSYLGPACMFAMVSQSVSTKRLLVEFSEHLYSPLGTCFRVKILFGKYKSVRYKVSLPGKWDKGKWQSEVTGFWSLDFKIFFYKGAMMPGVDLIVPSLLLGGTSWCIFLLTEEDWRHRNSHGEQSQGRNAPSPE